MEKNIDEIICKYQMRFQGEYFPLCKIINAPVFCPASFKECPNRALLEDINEK